MINKNQSITFENQYDGVRSEMISPLASLLIQKRRPILRKHYFFPDSLLEEIEDFASRNEIAESSKSDFRCCPDCLKAHVVKKARDSGLDSKSISLLSKIFRGKLGHEGYYLDKEELIKLS